ncbi:MAG TPA: helix-turn-helix domain-containing protein [Alphaproteobacteria bacterium]|nr:helix-turn-helix domain-containing protein [Alphaproteobacteria bacterium]
MLHIYLQIQDATLREALEELLPQAGIQISEDEKECDALLFTHLAQASALPALNFNSLPRPVRFRELHSHLESLPYSQDITIAHFSLDIREKILKNLKTQEVQRLTEKECQLLRFFHQNKGKDVPKDRLLKEIWQYHPESETHTLETHIYRLRQKLETDPNVPEILLNGKDGYWIK